jgi:hypothetical protein
MVMGETIMTIGLQYWQSTTKWKTRIVNVPRMGKELQAWSEIAQKWLHTAWMKGK